MKVKRAANLHEVHTDSDHVIIRVRVYVGFGVSVLALVVTPRALGSLVFSTYLREGVTC